MLRISGQWRWLGFAMACLGDKDCQQRSATSPTLTLTPALQKCRRNRAHLFRLFPQLFPRTFYLRIKNILSCISFNILNTELNTFRFCSFTTSAATGIINSSSWSVRKRKIGCESPTSTISFGICAALYSIHCNALPQKWILSLCIPIPSYVSYKTSLLKHQVCYSLRDTTTPSKCHFYTNLLKVWNPFLPLFKTFWLQDVLILHSSYW